MVVRCSADKFYDFLNNLSRDLILQKQNILHTDLKINMEYISCNAITYTQTLKTKNGYIVKYT